MRKWTGGLVAISLIFFGVSSVGFADVNELAVLKEQVEKLNKRVNDLEAEKQARAVYVAPTGEATSAPVLETALSGIKMTGFVDTAYHWNFDSPPGVSPTGTTVDRNQSTGVFDTVGNSFTLHAVELAFEKPAPATGGVGFRTDLFYGQDAKVIASGGTEVDDFDLQQAYVEARMPIHALEGNKFLGDSLYVRAGKYVTLSGAEVIEAKDNWNTTRSYMFGYSIPFTHTGIRAAYGLWGGKVTLTTGLNNGWDLVEDNNRYRTWEGQIAFQPTDKFLFTATTYIGPENLNAVDRKRGLIDFVALWKATDKLSLMGNIDYAREGRAVGGPATLKQADWDGYALYARYQATDKLAFATRGELFVDHDTFRVGAGNVAGGVARERTYWEWTYTGEYKLYTNLISRLEYRYDWADTDLFSGESSQSTLSAQLIYNFA